MGMSVGGGADRPPPDLTFQTEPGVSSNVQQLGEVAQRMLDSEGRITEGDLKLLKSAAEALMNSPTLPPPADRQALENWLQKLSTVVVNTASTQTLETLDPKVLTQLSSTNPEELEAALNTIFGTRLTPEQKIALKEGLMKKNEMPGGNPNLKSWNPEVIKQELKSILKEAASDPTKNVQQLTEEQEQVLDQVADDVSTLNILSLEEPPMEPFINTLTTSENKAEILDALLSKVDTSDLSEAEMQALKDKLGELAEHLATANKNGQPFAPISDREAMSEGFEAQTTLSDLNQELQTIVRGAISQIADSIADKVDVRQREEILYTSMLGLTPPGGSNPYMTPGVMALLAPILSELGEIYAEIMIESSKMQQNMMGLMLAMAQEAFTFAIAAGEAKVEQLEVEMQQFITQAAFAGAMIGVSACSAGLQGASASRANSNWKQKNPQVNNEDHAIWADQKKTNPDFAEKEPPKMRDSTDGDFYRSPEGQHFHTKEQMMQSFLSTFTTQFGAVGDNSIKAYFTAQKMEPTMEEARMNAMKEFISQLVGVITETMRKFQEEGQRADKDWQSFNQLFRDMGQTIRQAIYGQA